MSKGRAFFPQLHLLTWPKPLGNICGENFNDLCFPLTVSFMEDKGLVRQAVFLEASFPLLVLQTVCAVFEFSWMFTFQRHDKSYNCEGQRKNVSLLLEVLGHISLLEIKGDCYLQFSFVLGGRWRGHSSCFTV